MQKEASPNPFLVCLPMSPSVRTPKMLEALNIYIYISIGIPYAVYSRFIKSISVDFETCFSSIARRL